MIAVDKGFCPTKEKDLSVVDNTPESGVVTKSYMKVKEALL